MWIAGEFKAAESKRVDKESETRYSKKVDARQ